MADERAWARRSLGAAGVLAAVSVLSAFAAPVPCGGLAKRYPPIIAFELARTQADLDALFGEGPSACRDALVRTMDVVNVIDLAVFMPAYGAFLAAWFVAHRGLGVAAARAGVGLAVGAVAFDALENACLLGLTPELRATSAWLGLLPWATGAKWGALGLAAVAQAALLARAGLVAKLGAVLALVAPVGVVAALASPSGHGATLAASVGVAWLVCVATAAARALRRTSV